MHKKVLSKSDKKKDGEHEFTKSSANLGQFGDCNSLGDQYDMEPRI